MKLACTSCEENSSQHKHPDHSSSLLRLKKIKGQISGIEKMIIEQRYCVDILTQFRAVSAALDAVEAGILEKHIRSCLSDALASSNKKEIETKINELMKLIGK